MENDRTEITDLAQKEPAVFESMKQKFEKKFKEVGAADIKF